MPQTQVQILSVTGRSVTTSRGPGTVYEIEGSDGNKYSTFKNDLATQANAMVGKGVVTLDYQIKTKGDFTNYYLDSIGGAVSDVQTPAPIPTAPSGYNGYMTQEREQKIIMQSSLATAGNIVSGLFNGVALGCSEEDFAATVNSVASTWFDLAKLAYDAVYGTLRPSDTPDEAPTTPETETPPKEAGIPW